MFIKKLEVQNYKSFLDKQSIIAGSKNVIVGKNGTGKSNLLSALSNLFLFTEDRNIQNNNNDEQTIVCVEIDNKEKRFLEPATFTIKMVYKDNAEFYINDRPVTKEEYRGILENAGLTKECLVMQGKINDIAVLTPKQRYLLICRIAGVEKYEESKSMALRYLNDETEERLEALIDKIEMKMKITDEYKKKAEEYNSLMKKRTEAEFELMNYELKELNEVIDRIVIEEQNVIVQDDEMFEYEMNICKEEIKKQQEVIQRNTEYLNKFDPEIIKQVKARLHDENPYDLKIENLLKMKEEAIQRSKAMEEEESSLYIEKQALKYFEVMGNQPEELSVLEEQLNAKRKEVKENKRESNSRTKHAQQVSERKEQWIKEKQLKEELKCLQQQCKELENKVLYTGNLSANVHEQLKDKKGVLGTIYALFDVPEKYINAYEAVCKNSLFWTVVENDEVATNLIDQMDGRTTFIALNRVFKGHKESKATDCKLPKLSDQIKCEEKFHTLLTMVCKDYYVADSLQTALEMSERYGVNVVTFDGDLFNKNGTITGGFEGNQHVLRDLKICQYRAKEVEAQLKESSLLIAQLNEQIKYTEFITEEDSRVFEKLKALVRYLEMKVEYTKKRKITLPDTKEVERKHNEIMQALPKQHLEIEAIESQVSRAMDKKKRIDDMVKRILGIEQATAEIQKLNIKEKALVDAMYVMKTNTDIESAAKMQKKHFLIDKRSRLVAKIGLSDWKSLYIKTPKEQLISTIKEVNRSLTRFQGFSKAAVPDDHRDQLKQKLVDLREAKATILSFIELLDSKKEHTFNLSFSMICDNFTYFFKRLAGQTATLVLRNDAVDVLVEGQLCDINALSGGQKTVVALCLLFAVQKNDESPFYLFDEIDANLDPEHCARVAEIIKESNSQFFVNTFKSHFVEMADRLFGVTVLERTSFVSEISKETALASVEVVN